VSSPKEKDTPFAKKARILYLPTWTFKEISDANLLAYKMPSTDIDCNFERWGGIARYVFMHPTDSTRKMSDAVRVASNTRSLAETISALANATISSDIVDRLCHIIVNSDFDFDHRAMASLYVVDTLVQIQFQQLRDGELRAILQSSSISDAGAWRGHVFERYCHRLFLNASEDTVFLLQSLQHGIHNIILALRGVTFRRFYNIKELAAPLEDRAYWWPTVRNLPSADAFLRLGTSFYIFQDTVSRKHPVNGRGLRAILALFPDAESIHLVFRIPEDISSSFSQQTYTKHDGNDYVNPGNLADIHQYKCIIPLTATVPPRLE
jgi:hypothetical protein